MAKQAITQRSFMIGQPREEFLEASDLDILANSLRLAENVRIKATRTIAQRLGSEYLANPSVSTRYFEIRPQDGLLYALSINTLGQVRVLDEAAATVWSGSFAPLTTDQLADLWVEPFGYQTVIGGSDRLRMLTYSGGTFSLGSFAFDAAPGDELAQPYWSFIGGITLTPSARTGSITVTASAALFSAAWVGMRIRYGRREILITAYTSATQVTGTVQSQLPPTFQLTLSSVAGITLGDFVDGADTNYQGQVLGIAGSDVIVATTTFFDGPDISEKLSFPSGTATVSAKVEISPAAWQLWDEPLISPVRGYPRSGAAAAGRLFLCDFLQAPDAICASSARTITDFKVGADDADGIARAIGDNRPRLLNVVNAGDVIILADTGCYLISLRDGTALTPSTFTPIKFDARGAAPVRPVKVDDGIVFIEAGYASIAVAALSGNIYLKWSVRTMSTYHDQLFTSPVSLCGPPTDSDLEDKYLFVINDDGTLVAMSWVDGFDVEKVGFVPWTTRGNYLTITPIFGGYWATVERTFSDTTSPVDAITLERFSESAIMDCQAPAGSLPSLFNKTTVDLAGAGWDGGEVVADGGAVPDVASYPADAVAGFNFISRVKPWPQIMVQHPKAGLLPSRVLRVSASVFATGVFQIRCNRVTRQFGGYSFGDDLSEPAPDRTQVYRASVVGRRDKPDIEIIKPRPAQFQVLAITQDVAI